MRPDRNLPRKYFPHWHHCASQHRLNDFTALIGRHVAQADDPVAGPGTRRPQIDNFGFYSQHVARSHHTRPAQKKVIDPFNARLRGAEGVNQRMGGDSNPRCLSAHTLSRRAQSTTLSPIQVLDRYLTISILTPRITCSSKSEVRTRSHSESCAKRSGAC